MAEETKKAKGKKWVPYAVAGAGGLIVYLIWRQVRAGQSASVGTSTTDGNTVPPSSDITGGSGSASTTTGSAQDSVEAWIQSFLTGYAKGGYSNSQALNDVSAWLNGQCVSAAGFTALGNAVASLGEVPGYSGVTPSLSVCSAPGSGGGGTTPPPAAPSSPAAPANAAPAFNLSAIESYLQPGDSIVDQVFDDATQTWVAVSKNGGVFTESSGGTPGGTFFGSIQGLPASDTMDTNPVTSVKVNPSGGYTLTKSDGATYNFGPGF